MKIAVIGLGFVGLSLTSVLASRGNNVMGLMLMLRNVEKSVTELHRSLNLV